MEHITIEDQRKENLTRIKQKKGYFELVKPRVNLQRIKELRTQYCLTNTDMAYYLGLKSPDAYNRRENGYLEFKSIELYKIMDLFGTSFRALIKEDSID